MSVYRQCLVDEVSESVNGLIMIPVRRIIWRNATHLVKKKEKQLLQADR